MPKPPPRTVPESDPPLVSFREEPAGRETLSAIFGEKRVDPASVRSTRHYGDRISNAPGAISPQSSKALDTQPDISVTFSPVGRATYAELHRELDQLGPEIELREPPAPKSRPQRELQLEALEISSLFTFIVKAKVEDLLSPMVQSDLVKTRLLSVLPIRNTHDIQRIEVTPWHESGTVLVRVFCRVP